MSTAEIVTRVRDLNGLRSGDRMTREEFHALYESTPDHVRAELIGGIVYVAPPLSKPHAVYHMPLSSLLFDYETATPGTESGDNGSIVLGDDSEPQPDLYLRVLPECGGRSHDVTIGDNEYVGGPPELVVEIANSSHALDLHAKREDYARYGVLEYVVLSIVESRLHWFDLAADETLDFDDGVIRSRVFPGLWIDTAAVLERDGRRIRATLERGLATSEHAAFVTRLGESRAASR
jgi:Uma2 family endonuclease